MIDSEKGVENCSSCGGPTYACGSECRSEKVGQNEMTPQIKEATDKIVAALKAGEHPMVLKTLGASAEVLQSPQVQEAGKADLYRYLLDAQTTGAEQLVDFLSLPQDDVDNLVGEAFTHHLRDNNLHLASSLWLVKTSPGALKTDGMRFAVERALRETKYPKQEQVDLLKAMVGLEDGGSEAESIQNVAA